MRRLLEGGRTSRLLGCRMLLQVRANEGAPHGRAGSAFGHVLQDSRNQPGRMPPASCVQVGSGVQEHDGVAPSSKPMTATT